MGAWWGGTTHGDWSTAVGNLQSCKPLCVREPLRCSYTRTCLHDTGVVCVQLYSVSLQPRLHTTRGIILSHVWRWRALAVSFSRSTNPSLRRQWIKLPWILNYTCCLPSASRASRESTLRYTAQETQVSAAVVITNREFASLARSGGCIVTSKCARYRSREGTLFLFPCPIVISEFPARKITD